MKKIVALVIALLSVQVNTTLPMASLHALKDSVLKDKGLAFVAAGAGVAAITSLATAAYCYRNKKAYAKHGSVYKETLRNEIQTMRTFIEKNNVLLQLSSIKAGARGEVHKVPASRKSKAYATLAPERSISSFAVIMQAWEKELKHNKEIPEDIKNAFAVLKEESGGVPNEDEFNLKRKTIVEHLWFVRLKNSCDRMNAELKLKEEELLQTLSYKELVEAKALSWSKLLRRMGLGYLTSAGLMFCGCYHLSKKA